MTRLSEEKLDLIWPVLCRIKKIRKHEYLSSSFFWFFFCNQNHYKVIFMVMCKYSDQDRIPHSGDWSMGEE